MADRPRLLFLAYYFPPLNAVATVRAWNVAKYLSRIGWEVNVVTPDPSLWRSPEALAEAEAAIAREGVRRLITGHRWRCLANGYVRCRDRGLAYLAGGLCRRVARCLEISPIAGWTSSAYRACHPLRPGDVDVILATGSPYNAFEIARQLGSRLGCPYVLDYRDPWSTGDPIQNRRHRLRHAAVARAERAVLSDCSAVITVSPGLAEVLAQIFGVGGKVHVITNGYDPEEMGRIERKDFGHFAIVYAGALYPPWIELGPVLASLRLLTDDKAKLPDWRFHFFGGYEAEVRQAAEQYGLQDRLVLHGRVTRRAALEAVGGAGVSVVIASVAEVGTAADRAIVTGKLFDALGQRTPILLVAPPGNDAETILETTGLGRRFTASDTEGMAAFLRGLMCGAVPRAKNPEAHSWPELARKLDGVLRPLVSISLRSA